MILGRNRTYRGHRTRKGFGALPSILLSLIALIILAAIAAFSLLPQYLVYYPDGVELVVPSMQESGEGFKLDPVAHPVPYAGSAEAYFEVSEPDYSLINYGSIAGLDYLQAYYVPFAKVSSAGLENAVKEASRTDTKGLVLQMKDETGMLAWLSSVDKASSLAINGTWDPTAELAELKADGWYLAAELTCAVDSASAEGDTSLALRDLNGFVYADDEGSWVDLWNLDVRSYIAALCRDLYNIGFDEVILDRVEQPLAEVTYTREIAASLNKTAAAMNFSIAVRRELADTLSSGRHHLCAKITHDALSEAAANGQGLENFLKVYDRIIVETTTYHDDAQCFIALAQDSTLRYVPQMDWTFSGGSWILDPTITADEEE